MLNQEDNDLLCRVEGDAPMGQIMRRHWIPACLSEEVTERDGDPVRVRLLGEDLVAFRDSKGRVGLVGENCPHRRASLVYGRNEECGLRCLYHGWKVDVDGNVVEMSSEPEGSRMVGKVKHKAYPTHEAGGFVWTYMGPAETMPEFEAPFFAPTPDTKVATSKVLVDCNWAQVLEGAIDSSHSSTLHSSDMVSAQVEGASVTDQLWLRPSNDRSPRLQAQRTSFGFRYAAIRKPIKNPETHEYIRTTLFIAPYSVLIPPNDMYKIALLHIPMDDTHTAFHFIAWGDAATTPDTETWRKFLGLQVGIDVDAQFCNLRTRDNNYKQDRAAMRAGNFTGIRGIPNQDIVMWETMGPIADRSQDRLGSSDLAIVTFRRVMLEAARTWQQDGAVIGRTQPHIPLAKLRTYEGVAPKSTNWRTLNVSPEELAANENVTVTAAE